MKVSELTGAELDYWVAKAEGRKIDSVENGAVYIRTSPTCIEGYLPSIDWIRSGEIIDRERISIDQHIVSPEVRCWIWDEAKNGPHVYEGKTTMIAAMRCFVASKFGEEVPNVPYA